MMSDSNRVGQEAADAVERLLLQAGRTAAPPGAKARSLAAVSSVLGGALVTSQAAASGTLAGAGNIAGAVNAGSLTALHFIAVMGFTGVGAVAGAMLMSNASGVAPTTHAGAAAPSVVRAKSAVQAKPTWPTASQSPEPLLSFAATDEVSMVAEAKAQAESKDQVRAAAQAPVWASRSAAESPPPPVRVEITMLEEARRAVSAGAPARALSILDTYVERFPHGTMAPEATLVRIEALVKAGDRPAAERAAEALGASTPDNPYRSRVRALLAWPNH